MCRKRKDLSQTPDGEFAEDAFLVIRAGEEFLEGGDKGGLKVDEAFDGQGAGFFAEFAEVPEVLGEDVEGAFVGEAAEVAGVGALGGGEGGGVEAARAEAEFAAVEQDAELDHEAVAALQSGKQRAGGVAGEEVAFEGVERPGEVEGVEGFGGFEEIAFAEIGDEVADERFGDGAGGGAEVGGELAGFLEDEAGVAVDLGGEEFERAGGELDAEGLGFGGGEAEEGVVAFAAEEFVFAVLLHPFEFLAAAIHRAGGDEDGDARGVGAFEEGLEFGDKGFGTVGTARWGVGEEIGVFEPDGLAVAEEGEGLDSSAKAGDDGFEFAEILDGTLDDLAGEFVGQPGGHFSETLASTPRDEEVVVAADKGKGAEGGGHGRVP